MSPGTGTASTGRTAADVDAASGAPGSVPAPPTRPVPDLATLDSIQRRLLWLATRIVDVANRREGLEIKVGGHQASSASIVSIMTALWFAHIDGNDKVAVKPHASPVYHAIKYLTGELDRSYLTTLRKRGGLQAYPSRTKDPDVADFSTGSVGLGAVAPLFSALVRRYADAHFAPSPPARFIATVGDAELDEGNVWEAIADPVTHGLGNFTMVVDLNRQSLDRVIPDIAAIRLKSFFSHAGWHVAEAKYGARLRRLLSEPGGDALRAHIDAMPNEAYQALFTYRGAERRRKFLEGADAAVLRLVDDFDDDELFAHVTDLGGHDLGQLIDCFKACDVEADRPSVVFAYTIKGWGLPMAGDPLNHAVLLSPTQIDALRAEVGLTEETEFDRFDPDSPEGRLCAAVGSDINNPPAVPRPRLGVPEAAGPPTLRGKASTQEAFGRTLTRLADVPVVGERLVTTAPDVSISTNLGGWVNKVGVYWHEHRDDHGGAERLLRWAPSPEGQHIELGLSEMNMFMLLGQLGLAHDHHDQHLLPVGTVYDPFVLRGLDAFIYSLYNDARFIVAGTPSGITLAPEGGAHQSTITAGVGAELPGLTYLEPAYATEVDWLLCDALEGLSRPGGESAYFRLSTRPVDQAPFAAAAERLGTDELRRQVLTGGYQLRPAPVSDRPGVTIVTTGVMAPEALAAADALGDEGVDAAVVHLTSPDLVYRSWQGTYRAAAATATVVRRPSRMHQLIPPAERHRPVVSVHDASSHVLAWLGAAVGSRHIPLGVDRFGESGTIADLHAIAGISTGDIINAALIAIYESAEGD